MTCYGKAQGGVGANRDREPTTAKKLGLYPHDVPARSPRHVVDFPGQAIGAPNQAQIPAHIAHVEQVHEQPQVGGRLGRFYTNCNALATFQLYQIGDRDRFGWIQEPDLPVGDSNRHWTLERPFADLDPVTSKSCLVKASLF
jgi:hypothetical protein